MLHKVLNLKTYAMFLLLVLVLLPFIIVSFYNYYSADDYFYALSRIERGFVESQKFFYETMNGRYTTTFYLSITPLAFGANSFAFMSPLIFILFFSSSVYYFCHNLLYKYSTFNKLLLTLLIITPYFSLLDNTAETIYWASGTASYGISLCFLFFFLGGITQIVLFNDYTSKRFYFSIANLILLVGSNETITIMLNSTLILLIMYNYFLHKKINYKLMILLFIGVVCTLIVLKSPGNPIRLQQSKLMFHYTIKEDLAYNSRQILGFFKNKIITWNSNYILLICDLLLYFMLIKLNIRNNKTYKPILWLFILAVFLMFFASFFPIFYTLGVEPPKRSLAIQLAFFILANLFFVFLIYSVTYPIFKSIQPKIQSVLFVGLLMTLVLRTATSSNNINEAYKSLYTHEIQNLKKAMDNRIDVIQKSNTSHCIINNILYRPTILYRDDLSETDSSYFANVILAKYYKKESVTVSNTTNTIVYSTYYNFDAANLDVINNTFSQDFSNSKSNSSSIKNINDYGVTIHQDISKIVQSNSNIHGANIEFKLLATDSLYSLMCFYYLNQIASNTSVVEKYKEFKANKYTKNTWITLNYQINFEKNKEFNPQNKVVFFMRNDSKSELYIDDLKINYIE